MAVVGDYEPGVRLPSWRPRYWWVIGAVLALLLPVVLYSWLVYVPSLNADQYDVRVPGTDVWATVAIADGGTVVVRRDGAAFLRLYGDSAEVRTRDGGWLVAQGVDGDPVLSDFTPDRLREVLGVRLKECRSVRPLDAHAVGLIAGCDSDRLCDERVGSGMARLAYAVEVTREKADDLDPAPRARSVTVAELRNALSRWGPVR